MLNIHNLIRIDTLHPYIFCVAWTGRQCAAAFLTRFAATNLLQILLKFDEVRPSLDIFIKHPDKKLHKILRIALRHHAQCFFQHIEVNDSHFVVYAIVNRLKDAAVDEAHGQDKHIGFEYIDLVLLLSA